MPRSASDGANGQGSAGAGGNGSEHDYRKLFLDLPLLVAVYDPQTLGFVAVSRAGAAYYGYTEEEFLQLTIEDLRPPEDGAAWQSAVYAAPLRGRRHHRGRHRKKNGEIFYVETISNDIEFKGKRARAVLALDISEQRQTQLALRRSEARLRALLELSADWFWEQDAQFRFVALGTEHPWPAYFPPAADFIGKTRWELPGLGMEDLEAHRRLLARHDPFRDLVVHWQGTDGTGHWVSISGSPIVDDQGRFTGYRGVSRDITAQRQAQELVAELNTQLEDRVRQRTAELEAAQGELEELAYSIAHDLRSPLVSIDGFARALQLACGASLDPKSLHYLERIQAGVRLMSRLTDAMLLLAGLSRVHLRVEDVDLAVIARDVLHRLQRSEPGRQLVADLPGQLWVRGDPRLLAQAMEHLIGNAWKFSAGKASTHVGLADTVSPHGERVLTVTDRGAGFDMAHAAGLFRPFQRLHPPAQFEGLGIGLTLAQKIIARHGGRIWAEARPGEGATIFFTLG